MVFHSPQTTPTQASSQLNYSKLILEKVHFDPALFRKEYFKSLRWLSDEERQHLHQWLNQKFGRETAIAYS